jgi:hypothetical protein
MSEPGINNNLDVQGCELAVDDLYREGFLPKKRVRP